MLVFAVGSALMNYAASDVSSPRSVAAYVMPPIALAIVVDRCVAATRRHVLGMRDGRSPWAVAGNAAADVARFAGLSVLYVLRFLVDRRGTCAGIRAAILNATPLPEIAAAAGDEDQDEDEKPDRERRERRGGGRHNGDTKTARFLAAVLAKYGDFGLIREDRVSRICTELAPAVGLDCGAARTALRAKVLAALPAGGSGAR